MTPDVVTSLQSKEPSPLHEKMLELVMADIKKSRGEMSKNYTTWDLQDQVFRGERYLDEDDVKQQAQDKPTKMIVPNTYAQVMSFTSFMFLMFKQNTNFFELTPRGDEDFGNKWKDCEGVMAHDWNYSSGSKNLFQNILDTARFGTAPMEASWTVKKAKVFVVPEAPMTQNFMGMPISGPAGPGGYQDFTRFEGNLVRPVSPYRWFPDTDFPLCDFYKGNFCSSEEDFTMGQLRTMEASNEVAGVDHIEGLPRDLKKTRGADTRMSFVAPNNFDPSNDAAPVIVTKSRRWIIPKNFNIDEKHPLGEETFPVLYTIWIANDSRVIRCEPCAEWHQDLGYGLSQFTPDMHQTVTLGLADLVYRLQDVISWFVNSHIASVRRVIQNRNIINPAFVETKSYDGEGDIFIRRGVGRMDPRMAVSQLPAQDVTGGHMADVDILGKLMQVVTGVNDNAMGQYNSGRRSASESRVVTAGAAGRMKMHGHLLWETCYARLGRMMLSNSRQSLGFESFKRVLGGTKDPNALMQRFADFKGTPEEIICGADYFTFDSTLSSEKGFMAQNLQELLGLLLQSNPMAAQQITMALDPLKIIGEMQYLRDGTPVQRFQYDIDPATGQPKIPMMPMMQPPAPAGSTLPPQ